MIALKVVFFALFVVGSFASAAFPAPPRDWRLIAFNETFQQWLPMEEVLRIAGECGAHSESGIHGFMDVTDHPHLGEGPAIPHSPYPTTLRFEEKFKQLNSSIDINNIRRSIETLSNYNNRYYTSTTGVQSAQWIKDQFQNYITASGRKDASVEFFTHSWQQPSVIATIKGYISSEKVIIGAHEDSIVSSMTVNSRAPGADDDASGTSTVLEVFRVLISDPSFVPLKTVEFHTYAAEEVGLRGSQDIASAYRAKNLPVKAMMQFDMTAYKNGNPAFVTDYVNADLTKLAKQLATKYTTVAWIDTTCGYSCSDHGSWTKANYPSCFPFESAFSKSNGNIHTVRDLISVLDLNHAREFAALGVGFVLELSN